MKIIYQIRRLILSLFPFSGEHLLPRLLTPGLFDTVQSSIGLDHYMSSYQNSVDCQNEVRKPNLHGVSWKKIVFSGFRAHTAEK